MRACRSYRFNSTARHAFGATDEKFEALPQVLSCISFGLAPFLFMTFISPRRFCRFPLCSLSLSLLLSGLKTNPHVPPQPTPVTFRPPLDATCVQADRPSSALRLGIGSLTAIAVAVATLLLEL